MIEELRLLRNARGFGIKIILGADHLRTGRIKRGEVKPIRGIAKSLCAGSDCNRNPIMAKVDRFAFETSVGLLGLSSSIIDVEENDETSSRVVYNIVNFTINLLALDFSLVTFF